MLQLKKESACLINVAMTLIAVSVMSTALAACSGLRPYPSSAYGPVGENGCPPRHIPVCEYKSVGDKTADRGDCVCESTERIAEVLGIR